MGTDTTTAADGTMAVVNRTHEVMNQSYTAFVNSEIELWNNIIKTAGIKPEWGAQDETAAGRANGARHSR